MTDTITPASLRAHAEHFAGRWHLVSEALIDEAARLEAESARDEEAETLAKLLGEAYEEHSGLTSTGWDGYTDCAKDRWRHLVAKALAFLAADGRLLPEGGTVLTAEQVAEARELLDAVDLDAEEFHLLRAAFTPPAVCVPDSGPDGTPEKPWPTWQDVPEGVEVVPTGLPERFVKIDGRTYIRLRAIDAFKRTTVKQPTEFAPFVRVDGDK